MPEATIPIAVNTPPPGNLADTQARYNRSTQSHWDHFAPHRRQIEDLLIGDELSIRPFAENSRLCVLGAGNCNDLDLSRLISAFAEVHLADIDPSALSQAVERQGVDTSDRIRLHPGVDLTGVASTFSDWLKHPPDAEAINACLRRIAVKPPPPLGGPFDVVLSPCILSQICGLADDVLKRLHPRAMDVRLALRHQHLRTVLDLLRPGGMGLIVTDIVSSQRIKDLDHRKPDELKDLMNRIIARRETFPALDPVSLQNALKEDFELGALVADVTLLPPWVWRLGPLKSFLVYALRFRRRATVLL